MSPVLIAVVAAVVVVPIVIAVLKCSTRSRRPTRR